MEKKDLEVKNFKIIDEETGELIGSLDTISIVKNPAIELDYQLFKQLAPQKQHFEINKEKQIITGPAMRANFKILRQDPSTKEYYYGVFSPEQIEACMNYYMQKGNTDKANFNHKDNFNDKFFITESWIVNDPSSDKAVSLGFKEVNKGDWYISYKVTDSTMWESIKNGDYSGFSVEANLGVFSSINESEIEENIKTILKDNSITEKEKEQKIKIMLNI